jgi:adenylate cyclase
LLTEKRTFFSQPDETADVLTSLAALDSFVAAPILDRDDRVIGALYGHRSRGLTQADGAGITRLEALLVETLACGVAAGLARLEQQRAAMARKVQFDQFFSAELSTELEAQPDLLAGRDTEVTVLFCDIRGFSRVSECLGPTHTMEWIGDVLSALSDEVVATGGVLVDYIGDAVLAMWGAPQRQPDHALRACRTARAMVRQAGPINTRWKPRLGASCSFGVGVNSAVARVGNIGSTRKFKYGPLGNGVNLGSRVEGATKYLRVPALVTGATRRLVGNEFHTRRLCTVRVVNIVEPVELHELDCTDEPMRRELFARYEEALEAFEQGDFRSAARMLGNLLAAVPGDGPSLVLLSRAVECMVHEPADFSPVWQLPGK